MSAPAELAAGLKPFTGGFDTGALLRHLARHVPGIEPGRVRFQQFAGGQSNPTYLVDAGTARYVLRKQPPGELLPSAHAVDREYAIQRSLQGSAVPVPRMVHLCTDRSVIGTLFYLMEYVEGRVCSDVMLEDVPVPQRAGHYLAMARTLAALHGVRPDPGVFRRPASGQSYFQRQLARWTANYRAAALDPDADMERTIAWLGGHAVADAALGISHGDYRLGNLIFDAAQPVVRAVLDWELTTLGPPLADLAYCCLPCRLPAGSGRGFADADAAALGLPAEAEVVAAYRAAGGTADLAHLEAFIVLALFRSTAITAGVYRRALNGNAVSSDALAVGRRVAMYARAAAAAAQQA